MPRATHHDARQRPSDGDAEPSEARDLRFGFVQGAARSAPGRCARSGSNTLTCRTGYLRAPLHTHLPTPDAHTPWDYVSIYDISTDAV